MTIGERGGELVSIAAAILITAFFVYHQVASTGFFTSAFGVPEAFLFYGVAIFGMIVSTLHAITGNRKTVRPVELASNVFFLITAVALFYIFPFNFAHLSNALPVSIRFLLSWITNDIGRILLAFGVLGASVATIVTTIKLTGDRKLFSERNESRNDDSAVATLPSEL